MILLPATSYAIWLAYHAFSVTDSAGMREMQPHPLWWRACHGHETKAYASKSNHHWALSRAHSWFI